MKGGEFFYYVNAMASECNALNKEHNRSNQLSEKWNILKELDKLFFIFKFYILPFYFAIYLTTL